MPSSLTRPRGRTLQPAPAARALSRTSLGLVLSLSLLAGCNSFADPNRSFLDPGEVVRSGGETLYQNILERIDAAEDPRREFTVAQPPRPEDLNVPQGDYVLSKNDLLSIEIADLQGPGTQTVKTTRVSESGNLSLPFIGLVKAEGLTEVELEQDIIQRYKAANILTNAVVSVSVLEARGRAFSISGAVQRPGQFAIIDPDFRLLDALVIGGDTYTPQIEDVYILRRTDLQRNRPSTQPGGTGPAPVPGIGPGTGTTTPRDDLAPRGSIDRLGPIQPLQPIDGRHAPQMPQRFAGGGQRDPIFAAAAPADDLAPRSAPRQPAGVGTRPTMAPAAATAATGAAAARPPTAKAVPLAPATRPTVPLGTVTTTRPGTAARPGVPMDTTTRPGGRYVTVGGQPMWVEDTPPVAAATPSDVSPRPRDPLAPGSPAPAVGASGTDARAGAGAEVTGGVTGRTSTDMGSMDARSTDNTRSSGTTGGRFEFNDLPEPENIRVIHIPLKRLREGELKYNVVIRPKDMIIVQNLQVGVYYMGGHVQRGGAFSLAGQKVTLMEAVIAAGMFDQVAIPARTDIVRKIPGAAREGRDRLVFVRVDLDRIFTGQSPDIYLKPDDRVMVGTNALAPFLAALRGSFRLTYGFGFLYDRNFAIDEERQSF